MLKSLILLTVLIQKASLELQIINDPRIQFGDALFWRAERNDVLFVDLFGLEIDILRFDITLGILYTAKVENAPPNAAFIIPLEGHPNEYAVGFSDRTVKRVEWNGISDKAHIKGILFSVQQDSYYEKNIWHYSRTDSFGRFFGGTMRTDLCKYSQAPDGNFYRFPGRRGGDPRQCFGEVQISNGIEFSVRQGKMFHIDACDFAIKSLDWNIFTGKLTNSRKVYQIFEGDGLPTYTALGLTMDTKQQLYAGIYNGGAVWKIDPKRRRRTKTFKIPTQVVTSIALGRNKLFVASSRLNFNLFTATLRNETLSPSAGAFFIIDVDAIGYGGKPLSLRSNDSH